MVFTDDKLVEEYNRLNRSFKKKFIFHLGFDAGFFSEYNNMILAMLYCLEHKIQFILYSSDANFGILDGWNDYFLPFCEENRDSFHKKYNWRYPRKSVDLRTSFRIKYYKVRHKIHYLTPDIWNEFHNREMEHKMFDIPQLGINGDLRSACHILIKMTWRYNAKVANLIGVRIGALGFDNDYIGFHIRQGDKGLEHDLISEKVYMTKASLLSSEIQRIFVLTDDYSVISRLKQNYPQWQIYTFCNDNERGYIHADFQETSKVQKYDLMLKLFSSMDVLRKSNFFIGTFSSNIGMFLGMYMSPSQCHGVDLEEWQIW